jgi:lipopolysaccharide export system permease protein
MKKIDKLILSSFLGPFFLTLIVITFIQLSKQMLYYFDDIIGKDLGPDVITKFIGYVCVLMLPITLPLTVLLSSLITFGNLAEHFELSAIKSAGVSPLRVLSPIFVFVVLLSGFAVYVNNTLAPQAALQTYSLLYDIRQKKPALDIREGTFYSGMQDISIKVNQKFRSDDAALKGIIVYDHRNGGSEVTVADSGRMSTIMNNRYMKFELFQGYNYTEQIGKELEMTGQQAESSPSLKRMEFARTEMVFDLSEFDLKPTNQALFANNKYMRNLAQLELDIDSLKKETKRNFNGQDFTGKERDPSISIQRNGHLNFKIDSLFASEITLNEIQKASAKARYTVADLQDFQASDEARRQSLVGFQIQWHRILSNAVACISMFLIGAPLGSIIKKGGIGVPFLISIAFFIVFTVLGMQAEDLATQGIWSAPFAAWFSNSVLFLIGMVFLRISYRDLSIDALFEFTRIRRILR